MKNRLPSLLGALIVLGVFLPVSQADDEALLKTPRQIYCPLICASPVIDGKLDEPGWRNAENIGLFMVAGQTVPAAGQTSGKIFYDGTNLYLGLKCAGPGAFSSNCRERDGDKIWLDEVVEIFILPGKDGNDYYHFAVNPAGTIYDSHVNQGRPDAQWNSHLQAVAFTDTNDWSVELRLPLADITPLPANGAEWRFNVCRESSSPLQEREISTWTCLPAGKFHAPQSFGFLYFQPPDDNYRKSGEAFAKSFVKQRPNVVRKRQRPKKNDNPAVAAIATPSFSNIVSAISIRHPRLFLNETTLSNIRTNMTPSQRQYLSELQQRVDAYPKPGTNAMAAPARDFGKEAADTALIYILTGEKKYCEKAFILLKESVGYYHAQYAKSEGVNWYSSSRIGALCAFDWLYNDLTGEQKKTVGQDLLAHILDTQDERKQPKKVRDGPSGWGMGFYGVGNLPWYAGLAFVKTGLNDEAALKLLENGYSDHLKMLAGRSEFAGDDGGSASACVAYAGKGEYQRAEYNFFLTWRTLMGTNFADYFPRLALFPNWLLWNAIPSDTPLGPNYQFFEFGYGDTWHINNRWKPSPIYLSQYTCFYKNKASEIVEIVEYLLAKSGYDSAASIYTSTLNYHLDQSVLPFLFIPDIHSGANASVLNGLPRARHFEKLGQIIMNSGWNADATFCLFTAGQSNKDGHKHWDENNFIIYRNGFLALDCGTRESSTNVSTHMCEYYGYSIAHNCMLIRMEGELPYDKYYKYQTQANGRGMCSQYGSELLAFETGDYYTYVASDAVLAYNSNKCDMALRQFVFVYPDYFVICDRVISRKPDQTKTWLLHTQNEPLAAGDTFSAEHWGGRLFCRTLLPRECKSEKIGGDGKEFWSDGRNWPICPERESEVRGGALYGRWRMEISPAEQEREAVFLHLLQVGDRSLRRMTSSELITTADEIGVNFSAGEKNVTVYFNRAGEAGGRIHISRGWFKTLVSRNFTSSVQPQSGLAQDGSAPRQSVQIKAKQQDRELKDYEMAEGPASVQIILTSADGDLRSRDLEVSVDGENIRKWVAEETPRNDRELRMKIKLKDYLADRTSRNDRSARDEAGVHVIFMESRKCRVQYHAAKGPVATFHFYLPHSLPAPSAVFLSDLQEEDSWLALKKYYQHLVKDKNFYSNQPIKIGTWQFAKGLMLTPPDNSNRTGFVEYNLPEPCRRGTFKAILGLDRSEPGSVIFRVKQAQADEDWKLVYESGLIAFDHDITEIAVPLNGKARLRLEVFAGKSLDSDVAVWADARIE